jgi:hypothetical protein
MKNLKVFLCAMFLVLSITGISAATEYWLPGVSTATGWFDVNKANVFGADSLMCWAASSSNNLAYTHWYGRDSGTNALITDPTAIYGKFTSSWGNGEGAPFYGYEWWFTNRATTSIPADPKVLDGGGLNFYPGVPIGRVDIVPNTVTMFTPLVNTYIPGYISDGRGISMSITVPNPSGIGSYDHSLTLWGYDPNNLWLWFTDSDDGGVAALRKLHYSVDASNDWTILGYSNLYTSARDVTIGELTRLNYNVDGIEPRMFDLDGKVPEPATLLLLGSGLLGLILFRKRI